MHLYNLHQIIQTCNMRPSQILRRSTTKADPLGWQRMVTWNHVWSTHIQIINSKCFPHLWPKTIYHSLKVINTCLPSGWLKNAKPKIQHVVKTCCLLLSLTFHLFSSFLFPHQCVPQACDWLTTFVYSSTSTAS